MQIKIQLWLCTNALNVLYTISHSEFQYVQWETVRNANKLCILYPRVDHDVQQDEDEEGQDLEEDVGDARHLENQWKWNVRNWI